MFLIQSDNQAMNGAIRRAGNTTDVTKLEEELLLADRRLAQVTDPFSRYRVAIGWLHLGNFKKYQQHCDILNSRFDYLWEPGAASQITKVCMLNPDSHRPEHLERAWELTEFASEFESAVDARCFFATRALAELRRCDFKAAHTWNQKCREGQEKSVNAYQHAMTYSVDALAWIGLGDPENAARSLEAGKRIHGRGRKKQMADGNDSSWHDSFVFQILEKEVEAKLKDGGI